MGRPDFSHLREETRGSIHIVPLTQRTKLERMGVSPNLTARVKRTPPTVTIIAPSFRIRGRIIREGVGKRTQPIRLPPITAKGSRTHMPLVITRSSSLDQSRAEA